MVKILERNIFFMIIALFLFSGCMNQGINVDDGIIQDEDGNQLGTPERPINVDQGGFLYINDINFNTSDFGNFSGDTELLFTDLSEGIIDNSSNMNKTLTLRFKTPMQIAFIGLGCTIPGKNFSNIKFELIGSGTPPAVILTIDQTDDDNKYSSRVPQFNPTFVTGLRFTFETTDEICLTNINLQKIQTVNAKTDFSPLNVNKHFIEFDSAVTTLNTAAVPGNTSLDVVDTTGFSVGDSLLIIENGDTETDDLEITAIDVVNDILTLDRPLDNSYTVGATVERVVIDMATLGTLTDPVIYEVCADKGEIISIERILFSMTLTTDSDDSRFGNIAGGITNGLTLRTLKNGKTRIIDNWKTNGDFRLTMFDIADVPKQGGGNFGLSGRYSFTKHGFAAQLNGETNDCLQLLNQDDLTPLVFLSFKAEGNVLTN